VWSAPAIHRPADHLALPGDRSKRVVGAGDDDLFFDSGARSEEIIFRMGRRKVLVVSRVDDQRRPLETGNRLERIHCGYVLEKAWRDLVRIVFPGSCFPGGRTRPLFGKLSELGGIGQGRPQDERLRAHTRGEACGNRAAERESHQPESPRVNSLLAAEKLDGGQRVRDLASQSDFRELAVGLTRTVKIEPQ